MGGRFAQEQSREGSCAAARSLRPARASLLSSPPGAGPRWGRGLRGLGPREGRGDNFCPPIPRGFQERLFKGPREGPGRYRRPLPSRLRGFSVRGPRMRRKAARVSRQGCVGTRSPRVGVARDRGQGSRGCVMSAGQRGRGTGWRGQERVKGGASPTNTRTRSLLRPVTRVPPALSRGWGEGAGACTVGTRAFGPSPLAEAHTRSSARTHLGHSHSASRDTRPERAHPAHTLTHACSQPLAASELRADPRPPPRKGAH